VRRAVWFAAVPLGGYALAQVLGRRAGATRAERREPLPGDQIVAHPQLATDHAITIGAPPEEVWPWLTQLGWHRAGFYTPRWVDRLLFPANQPSLDYLDPGLSRDLRPGDVIPDGPPGTAWYVVRQADPPRTLVLHSVTHVPAAWQREIGAAIDWTWCFQLTPGPGGSTRLHLRARGRTAPLLLTAAYLAAIPPADLIMAMGMLHGLRRRVQQRRPRRWVSEITCSVATIAATTQPDSQVRWNSAVQTSGTSRTTPTPEVGPAASSRASTEPV